MTRFAASDPPEVEAELWNFPVSTTRRQLGFDVGANCGQSIPHLLRLCQRVVAFEPNVDSFGEMNSRWGSHRSVYLSPDAVSDDDGYVTLAQLPGEQMETGQLVTPGTSGMEWDPGDWTGVAREGHTCWTLDSLALEFGSPDFVKVDTEGHEGHVLRGAQELIARHRPDWLIEFHSPELRAECTRILEAASYQVRVVRHPHYAPESKMWHQHGWLKALA